MKKQLIKHTEIMIKVFENHIKEYDDYINKNTCRHEHRQ